MDEGKAIALLANNNDMHIIVRQDLAESILRRNDEGIGLREN